MCVKAHAVPPAYKEAAVAAIKRPARWATIARQLAGLLGSLFAASGARAVDLGADKAELLYHRYDGGGVKASGPALLLRKSVMDKVAVTGTVYVDAVSNASIDVVTAASPFTERRTEYGLSADYVYRDSKLTLSTSSSKEPDYTANRVGLDIAQEVFGGMSTVNMGFTHGDDKVGKHAEPGFKATATHWQYRLGSSLILTPRWITSLNLEALADDGFLGSPYRVAYVFGAAVPERVPSTRSSRALKWRVVGDLGSRDAMQVGYRYYWDTWGIKASTLDVTYSRYFGDDWLADLTLRYHSQQHALFYSNNAQADTLYVSRNRQLSTFHDISLGGKVAYTIRKVPGQYDVTLNGALEYVQYKFGDFTDIRTGNLYSYKASVLQLFLSTNF